MAQFSGGNFFTQPKKENNPKPPGHLKDTRNLKGLLPKKENILFLPRDL